MPWYAEAAIIVAALVLVSCSLVFVVGPQLGELLQRDGDIADADEQRWTR